MCVPIDLGLLISTEYSSEDIKKLIGYRISGVIFCRKNHKPEVAALWLKDVKILKEAFRTLNNFDAIKVHHRWHQRKMIRKLVKKVPISIQKHLPNARQFMEMFAAA